MSAPAAWARTLRASVERLRGVAARLARAPLPWIMAAAAAFGACHERAAPRFPHHLHVAGLECKGSHSPSCLSCNSCHAPSARDRAQALPPESLCVRCHRDERREVRAVLAAAPVRPYGEIAFGHDRHLSMQGIEGQCVPCHGGVVKPGGLTLPPMSQCFSCHEHAEQWQKGRCEPCHALPEIRRALPQSFARHSGDFMMRHGALANQQGKLCRACHAQADCDSCHDMTQELTVERRRPEAVQAGFVHRGDFLTRHPIEAQSEPARCLRCHAPDTCDSCHVARGVSGSLTLGRSPHPPGWVGANTGSRSFHGVAARRDILLCASCHDQGPATNCIRCHKVGGYGGNPHPSGWKSTRSQNSQMCRYCHE